MASELGDDGGGEARRQAQNRLASLGEIAFEIAHELRNVLQVVSATAYVVRQEAARGDLQAALPHIAKLERSARTAHGIVDDLMALAHGDPRSESVSVTDVIEAARAELAPGAAHWEDRIDPPDLRVWAHPGLLVRLLHALYENAVQAAAPIAPSISTEALSSAGKVVIVVADDGPGIPEDVVSRVFNPLVTTRSGGTGLGLALARRIAEAHGGAISLVAAAAKGAVFRIELANVASVQGIG